MADNIQLLIAADDFGICDPIDNGILSCAHNLDCIEVFVNYVSRKPGDSSEARIMKLVKTHKSRIESGKLKIGLHLALTSGSPLYKDNRRYLRKMARFRDDGIWEFKHNGAISIIKKLDDIRRISKREKIDFLKEELWAQYNRFCDIMTKAGLPGYKPFHISAHLGVYGGDEHSYNLLKELCVAEDVEMRCPVLLGHSTDPNYKKWETAKTKMVPDYELTLMSVLGATGAVQNARSVRRWLRRLEFIFDEDKDSGEIKSTEFYIEHFFKQGSKANLLAIIDRLHATKSNREQTYEMVVHPVELPKNFNKGTIPKGINHGTFEKRTLEAQTIANMGNVRETFNLLPYKPEWKPQLEA